MIEFEVEAVTAVLASDLRTHIGRVEPGTIYEAQHQVGDWLVIAGPDGSVGYVPTGAVRLVPPPPPADATAAPTSRRAGGRARRVLAVLSIVAVAGAAIAVTLVVDDERGSDDVEASGVPVAPATTDAESRDLAPTTTGEAPPTTSVPATTSPTSPTPTTTPATTIPPAVEETVDVDTLAPEGPTIYSEALGDFIPFPGIDVPFGGIETDVAGGIRLELPGPAYVETSLTAVFIADERSAGALLIWDAPMMRVLFEDFPFGFAGVVDYLVSDAVGVIGFSQIDGFDAVAIGALGDGSDPGVLCFATPCQHWVVDGPGGPLGITVYPPDEQAIAYAEAVLATIRFQ